MNTKTKKLTLLALALAINIVGAKISLFFKCPLYLDSIGTMLSGIVLGPVAGGICAFASGLINTVLGDEFAIYFCFSGVLMGVLAGVLMHNRKNTWVSVIWKCLIIVLPGSLLSSCIETFLFGGITSAAFTTFAIKALSQTAMKLFGSAFLIQLATDYADKLLAIVLVVASMKRLPYEMTHFNAKSYTEVNE